MTATSPIIKIIRRWQKANPNPRCELVYQTPYQLLVSVVLSAQATDKGVNKAMAPLYEAGDFTPETVAKWGQPKLLGHIKSIGLAPTKSKNVIALTKILLDQHGGEVPKTREELEALPGVGRKTANVILGEIYRQPTIAVDTHVLRVSRRLGLHDETNPTKVEKTLQELIPDRYLPDAHHWFILHGRYTCKAAKPACANCTIADLCPSRTSPSP